MPRANFITMLQATMSMPRFRRFGRRRSARKKTNVIMHLPSAQNQVLSENTSVIMYAAVPANYGIIGTALGQDMFEQVDRSQNVAIGSHIDTIIYNIGIRDSTVPGIVSYAIFKVERAHEVPTANGILLPTDAQIFAEGLQQAMRRYQPGRILKYGQIAVAAEQPRTLSLKGNYKKFRMSKVRTGDYYGIILFNKAAVGGSISMDLEGRYQSYN